MLNFNCSQPEKTVQINTIQDNAEYHFKNLSLLEQALTHPSFAAEHNPEDGDNQRLEFLGDAVLQIILSDFLYQHLPTQQEGILTRTRSFLANEQATAQYAQTLQLEAALKLGHGEDRSGGRERSSILGDAFEAFLGALYLDGGIEPATRLVLRLLPDLDYCLHKLTYDENPKGSLQHFCLERYKENVHYEIISENGPVHQPTYTAQALLHGKPIGTGTGKSHKDAEKNAAADALEKLAQVQVSNHELLPIPNVTPATPKKPSQKKIIALDFDGVLCDSATENGGTAWQAARQFWPQLCTEETIPQPILNEFLKARPYLETGYQAIVMMKLFREGKDHSYFQKDFGQKIKDEISRENLKAEELIQAFGNARDQEIKGNFQHWLELHDFYPGTIQALLNASPRHKIIILSTKQERFLKALLQNQNVQFPDQAIFGLDRKLSKDAVLANLVGAKKTNVHFVEDRLDTLLRIQHCKQLARVKLHYAPWGYGTPEQLEQARKNPRIHVLTPASFTELLDD